MLNNTNLILSEIKKFMEPIQSEHHKHTALINPSDGRHAINIALLRWAGGAKQLTLTKYELPPDACGRIYTVDVFTGDVVGKTYTDWASKVHRGEYIYSGTSHTKGEYKTFPHVMLDYVDGSKKRRHYRPMMHTIIAYVCPETREQYAQAVLLEMQTKDRTFTTAEVQVNHMDKDVLNNSIYNLEVVTTGENIRHRSKTKKGVPYSAICDRPIDDFILQDLKEFTACGITDARKAYLDKLCRHISASDISPTASELLVKSVDGKYVVVPIKAITAWGILTKLFLAQAVCIVGVRE